MSGGATGVAAESAALAGITDEELLERLAATADEAALSELYDRYQASMYGLAMRITNDAGMAQDAMQEAFVGIWRNASRYSAGRASVRTWMLSITHHRAVDLVRRRRQVSALPETEGAGQVAEAFRVPDVWPEVARSMDAEAVRAAMASLPDAQREAIEMAYFQGLTQLEIAERTASPLGTIKSRTRLGLVALRRALEEPT